MPIYHVTTEVRTFTTFKVKAESKSEVYRLIDEGSENDDDIIELRSTYSDEEIVPGSIFEVTEGFR